MRTEEEDEDTEEEATYEAEDDDIVVAGAAAEWVEGSGVERWERAKEGTRERMGRMR